MKHAKNKVVLIRINLNEFYFGLITPQPILGPAAPDG